MDYHLIWYKCCPHWDKVPWPWHGSIPQRSRSHSTFKGQSTNACVRTITYVCIDVLPSYLVQMLSSLRWCSYIQEYLGYRSNNLYFLFSHSWPGVVYNFGQVQRTSQVERKTKCSKKKTAGDIAVVGTAILVALTFQNEQRIVMTKKKWESLDTPIINKNNLRHNVYSEESSWAKKPLLIRPLFVSSIGGVFLFEKVVNLKTLFLNV